MKKVRQEIDLPFEVGQTYMTKICLGEPFTITKIETTKRDGKIILTGFWGVYENNKHRGICPLGGDRLVPRKVLGELIEVIQCPKCKHEFND